MYELTFPALRIVYVKTNGKNQGRTFGPICIDKFFNLS